jgi:polyisoprenoid-binding protein YceI
MIRRRNQLVLAVSVVSALAYFSSADASAVTHTLEDGKVHFVCEGPEVTVPAWGQFGAVEGALSIDPSDLRRASGNIDVFMVSIRTNDSAWDTMFRRAGFLEIDDLPKSRFVLEAVRGAKKLEPGKWVPMTLEGRFALHGIRKKISVPATVRWSPADLKTGTSERIHVRASFHVTWDDYEIAMPSGRTRTFAGDGAIIQADLAYRPIESKRR